jgi:predicted membrane channel-forming protein YqfA (hemolysin III family)
MMRFIRPRLRKPLLRGIALLGIAGAWVIGSPTWGLAIVIAVVAVGQTVYWYTWAGEDTDESALLGSRADERQKQVGLRARALSGSVALAAAYIGLVITLAVRRADAWPFAALLAVAGFAYLLGLSSYGSGEPGPEDEVTAGHETRSPVNS